MHDLRLALCLAALGPAPALAELAVIYVDSYPDRISILNGSGCDLGAFELFIDLGASPATAPSSTSTTRARPASSAAPSSPLPRSPAPRHTSVARATLRLGQLRP